MECLGRAHQVSSRVNHFTLSFELPAEEDEPRSSSQGHAAQRSAAPCNATSQLSEIPPGLAEAIELDAPLRYAAQRYATQRNATSQLSEIPPGLAEAIDVDDRASPRVSMQGDAPQRNATPQLPVIPPELAEEIEPRSAGQRPATRRPATPRFP